MRLSPLAFFALSLLSGCAADSSARPSAPAAPSPPAHPPIAREGRATSSLGGGSGRAAAPRPPSPVVTEEPTSLERAGITLRGVIDSPKETTGRIPVVLLVASSGPVNRDGNEPTVGLATDAYRLLAEGLAARGIATLRYDKRGVGESTKSDPAHTILGDFVDDARAWVVKLHGDARFSSVSVLGHSEGGIIAVELAQDTPVDALVLVGTPGRPMGVVLREQLSRQVDAATLASFDSAIANLRAGKPIGLIAPKLRPLFDPSVLSFVRSWLDADPAALIAKTKASRIAVVQGDMDMQVSVDGDARKLAAADKRVILSVLPGMAHTLKTETARVLPQPSYTDPSRPLAPGLVDAAAASLH